MISPRAAASTSQEDFASSSKESVQLYVAERSIVGREPFSNVLNNVMLSVAVESNAEITELTSSSVLPMPYVADGLTVTEVVDLSKL